MKCTLRKMDKRQAETVAIRMNSTLDSGTSVRFYATPCPVCNSFHVQKGK